MLIVVAGGCRRRSALVVFTQTTLAVGVGTTGRAIGAGIAVGSTAVDVGLVGVLLVVVAGRTAADADGRARRVVELTDIAQAVVIAELALLTGGTAATIGATAVHIGLESVLGVVVTGGRQAALLPVAIATDAVLAVGVDQASRAIGAAHAAAVAAAVGVRLVAVLDLVETARGLTDIIEAITDQALAVAADLAVAAVGTAGAIAATVEGRLVAVEYIIVAMLTRCAGAVFTEAAAALVVSLTGGSRRAAHTGAARATVDAELRAVADTVVTGGGLARRAAVLELTDFAEAVVIAEAGASITTGRTVGAAAVGIGLEAVLVAIVTAGRGTYVVGTADAVLAISVTHAVAAVCTGVTTAAAVHIGLVTVLDIVVAGRAVAALAEEAITELSGTVLGQVTCGAIGATIGAATGTVHGQLVAVLHTVVTGWGGAIAIGADAARAVFRIQAAGADPTGVTIGATTVDGRLVAIGDAIVTGRTGAFSLDTIFTVAVGPNVAGVACRARITGRTSTVEVRLQPIGDIVITSGRVGTSIICITKGALAIRRTLTRGAIGTPGTVASTVHAQFIAILYAIAATGCETGRICSTDPTVTIITDPAALAGQASITRTAAVAV